MFSCVYLFFFSSFTETSSIPEKFVCGGCWAYLPGGTNLKNYIILIYETVDYKVKN